MIEIRRAGEKGRGIELNISKINRQFALLTACSLILSMASAGCGNKFWDPTQVGRFSPKPALHVILPSLGVEEEAASAWEGAEEPRPMDVIWLPTDNVFSPGDVVRVSIFELLREFVSFTNDYMVTETGKISIPEVAQRRAFSILGLGIGAPGRYFIPRYEFRLADAIATAQGIGEFNVGSIYVVHVVTGQEVTAAPREPADPKGLQEDLVVPKEQLLEIIKPQAAHSENDIVVTSVEMATEGELGHKPMNYEEPGDSSIQGNGVALSEAINRLKSQLQQEQEEKVGRVEWVFRDGRWVPVPVGGHSIPTERPKLVEPARATEPLEERMPAGFGWDEIGSAGVTTRVIEIPLDRFQSGDPRYNVVIRPGDTIYVPVDIIGEFYVTGNVNRQGAIPLTGRPITLKMAIAAAGGLGPLAWPKRCEVIRRIGKNREEIVMVDLEKIYNGEQPDFFIKVNDLINVGTHPTARWRAVLRNSFRASYGFGFIYDRNFADRDFLTHRPFPDLF